MCFCVLYIVNKIVLLKKKKRKRKQFMQINYSPFSKIFTALNGDLHMMSAVHYLLVAV